MVNKTQFKHTGSFVRHTALCLWTYVCRMSVKLKPEPVPPDVPNTYRLTGYLCRVPFEPKIY